MGEHAGVVEQADFFAYKPPFETSWIYERAFLCALPRDRWQDYAVRMAELLRPGALLAGFYFLGETPKGPPFGIERDALDALLTPYFELVEEHEVTGSIDVFAGRERWLTWRRRAPEASRCLSPYRGVACSGRHPLTASAAIGSTCMPAFRQKKPAQTCRVPLKPSLQAQN